MNTLSIILGVDPGSRKMGYGLIRSYRREARYLASGCIYSKEGQLSPLFEGLASIIQQYEPTEAAIEAVFSHRNPKSALILGQARGVALLALEMAQLATAHYAPRTIKKAVTGYGAAQKIQMQHMMQQILQLSEKPSVDASDALSVALCHINHQHYDHLP